LDKDYLNILNEIREVLKVLADGQEQLLSSVKELREEQKKLYNEIRLNNMVISSFPVRNEIIN
jgi:hypothetical protein